MLLIKNGNLYDPKSGVEGKRDILIENGRIKKIASEIKQEEAPEAEIIDAQRLSIAPGLVDVHVHFRDPGLTYKEDIMTGASAAKRGGFTSVVCMANTKPVVDSAETLRYCIEKGKETGIHVYQSATVTEGMQGKKLTDMSYLKKSGAPGFTDDGVPILEEELVRKAMKEAALLDVPLSFHEENPEYIQNNGINDGAAAKQLGIGGSNRRAEISMAERDLRLALETGASINIQHISSAEAVELVRQAKRQAAKLGQSNIHAEATPHHFTLTEEAVLEKGTLAKMNPPLRTEEDRAAIIEGLKDGTIDLIATDHAPHSSEEKDKPLTEAPSGIIGLETALSLGITELVDTGKLTMLELLEKMTVNPAKLYHLDAGCVAEGGPADLVLFDSNASYVVKDFASKSSNSPFLGETLKGEIIYTICDGRIVWSKEKQIREESDK